MKVALSIQCEGPLDMFLWLDTLTKYWEDGVPVNQLFPTKFNTTGCWCCNKIIYTIENGPYR